MSEHAGRRVWMIVVGAIVLVVAVVASALLWSAGGRRLDDNVAGFARAPVGCDTTLDFDRSGEFTLFVETTGTFDELVGECAADTTYDRDPSDKLRPALTLIDPNGDELTLEDVEGDSYDVDGFVGTSYRRVQIDTPGDHILTVGSTDGAAFAIAIGHDPNEGVAQLRWGSIATALVGIVLAGVLLVLGSRRTGVDPAPTALWTPEAAAWPSSPPGFPTPPPTTGAEGPERAPAAPPPMPGTPPWVGSPQGEPPPPPPLPPWGAPGPR